MVTAIVLLSVVLVSGAFRPCEVGNDLFITVPRRMTVLNGSCLHIPCNYNIPERGRRQFNSSRSTFGVWIKQNINFAYLRRNVIFNSSRMNNTYPMSLIGNLSQNDCTTLFSKVTHRHTDRYYFRIENGPYMATALCEHLVIQATDWAPRPRIEISGDLKEKGCVTITCSAFTPCLHSPPNLTWTLQQNPHNEIVENKDRTFATEIQTSFILSDKHDGLIITCSARYPLNEGKDVKAAEKRTKLRVSYAPKDTSVSISPSGLLSAGSLVNLTCSSRANPVSRFTWFKTRKSGPVSVSERKFYSFKVTSVTDIDDYYCVATNYLGSQTSPRSNKAGTGSRVNLVQWGPALGGTLLIIIICLAISVWWFKSKRPQTQTQRGDELTFQMPAFHYGGIDFPMRAPELSLASEQDSGQQQDNVSESASMADVSESASMANVSESASMAKVSESESMANVSKSASS